MPDSRVAIRILIFDEQPVVRLGLRSLLDNDPTLKVVGETGQMGELERLVDQTQPNVLVVDPGNDPDGLESLCTLCRRLEKCIVIIYTTRADQARMIMAALKLGVSGFLLKEADLDELVHDIHTVCEGNAVLAPAVANALVEHFYHEARPPKQNTSPSLSGREIEVLQCLAKGKSNLAIAELLYVCESTVKFHVHSILEKLSASNRTEAVLNAVKRGYIHLGLALMYVVAFFSETCDTLPL